MNGKLPEEKLEVRNSRPEAHGCRAGHQKNQGDCQMKDVDFKKIFRVLRRMFDSPTPSYESFDSWRWDQYERQRLKQINNLPLKTWWPKYGERAIVWDK